MPVTEDVQPLADRFPQGAASVKLYARVSIIRLGD